MPGGGGRRGWSRGSGAGDSGDRIKRSARKRKSRKYPRKAQPDVVAHTTQEAETGGLTERGGGGGCAKAMAQQQQLRAVAGLAGSPSSLPGIHTCNSSRSDPSLDFQGHLHTCSHTGESQVWSCMPFIPALRRSKQADL